MTETPMPTPESSRKAALKGAQASRFKPKHMDDEPDVKTTFYGIGMLVAAIVVIGMWLVGRYADMDYARDVQGWREKLNLIAESRDAEVEGWISKNVNELQALADNPSLRMYVTELKIRKSDGAGSRRAPEPSQMSYLRNLLLYTAQRTGYNSSKPTGINANTQTPSNAGIAILDQNHSILVATVFSPEVKTAILEHAKTTPKAKASLINIQAKEGGEPYLGFSVPIYGIQSERNEEGQLGQIIALQPANGSGLYAALKHPGIIEESLETVLAVKQDGKVAYLSPLLGGMPPLTVTQDASDNQQNMTALVGTGSGFTNGLSDYRETPVMATSRKVEGTPWTLITKIDRDEALGQSAERRAGMQMVLFLLVAVIALIVAATWWRVNAKRSLMMTEYFQRSAERARAQEQLLRLVADHQPEPIYIIDRENVVHFANQQAASKARMSVDMIPGRSLADVRGGARAAQLAERCEEVLGKGTITYEIERQGEHRDTQSVFRSAFVPLKHIPLAHLPKHTPGMLVVEQDITAVVRERELRVRTNRQLVETLVALVDKRDPFSANHSKLVSQLAYEVATVMELDSASIETASKAGMLMNIGKIIVPTELLTKSSQLTFDEKKLVHDSMNMAAELMDSIDFDGPVSETLRQWQEKWDGTGPLGLKEEDILLTARIIAATNAFIGMVSPRAWRTAMSLEAAEKFMMDACHSHFDRRVVVALLNFIDNHEGKEWLAKVVESNQEAA